MTGLVLRLAATLATSLAISTAIRLSFGRCAVVAAGAGWGPHHRHHRTVKRDLGPVGLPSKVASNISAVQQSEATDNYGNTVKPKPELGRA